MDTLTSFAVNTSELLISTVGIVPAGLCVLLFVVWQIRMTIFILFFTKAHALSWPKNFEKSYGLTGRPTKASYIVVSGATNRGIGFAFADEFASRGFSLVLIGRGQEKLEAIAAELKQGRDLDVICVEILDMGEIGSASSTAIATLTQAIDGLDVAGVVHAAGVETISRQFSENSVAKNRIAINLNAASPVLLTQALIPRLTQRVATGLASRSAVIFVGAGAGLRPSPHLAVYAATKSMLSFFAQAISVEFDDSLDVLCTHPLAVASAMMPDGVVADGLSVISPARCAKASLVQLGHSWARHSWTNGWWFHAVQWGLMSTIPDWLYQRFWIYVYKKHKEKKQTKQEEAKQLLTK